MSENGKTFLNIFGLDNVDNETLEVRESGDGKIDINGNLINNQYGELFLPFYMPFAYDESAFGVVAYSDGNYNQYWGNSHPDLNDIFNEDLSGSGSIVWDSPAPNPGILIYNDGPAMYYSSNANDYPGEHEFLININHSSASAVIPLGFMIAENSETVMLNSSIILTKGIDYNTVVSDVLNKYIKTSKDYSYVMDAMSESVDKVMGNGRKPIELINNI